MLAMLVASTDALARPQVGTSGIKTFEIGLIGDDDVHWVRATVDTRDPEVLSFQPEIVEENVTP